MLPQIINFSQLQRQISVSHLLKTFYQMLASYRTSKNSHKILFLTLVKRHLCGIEIND